MLPHKYKIVIAGNHELSLDKQFTEQFKSRLAARQDLETILQQEVLNYGNTKDNISDAVNTENIKKYLTNCIYLEDSGIELYGIKLWGTPWYVFNSVLFKWYYVYYFNLCHSEEHYIYFINI